MQTQIQVVVAPVEASDNVLLKKHAANILGISENEITYIKILKRSIDSRSRNIKILLTLTVFINEEPSKSKIKKKDYKNIAEKESVIIVGAGPAGLFAALKLIELGKKPIILERGKDVQSRRRDLAAINKLGIVNPHSNYCFGEGGAGTYSDGKLYTRSTKRGDVNEILSTFVAHGADETILIEAHPHIGTNKLPKIIIAIRETILQAGGEIHFNTLLTDLIIESQQIKGVLTSNTINFSNKEFIANNVILATGHSARDIFELLYTKKIVIEAKPFAMGVRIEHPQTIIDSIQYHCNINNVEEQRKHLPAASYSLVQQVENRGVYSFCMCPGGIIAPCATAQDEVVTNGWSPSKRNNPYANSGIVVSVEKEDFKKYDHFGALAGMHYQKAIEQRAWIAGGKTQTAPAQRLLDFTNNKLSSSLPNCSYQPGLASVLMDDILPHSISKRLQIGFKEFGKKMRGYLTNEAVIVGVESRTSSPVRIPRDKNTLEHIEIKGLFPCGEGAGYAGGIISAAIDGQRVAEQCVKLKR